VNDLRPNGRATALIVATGLLLGTCAFLAAKIIHPPPIDPLDVEFWDVLGAEAAVLELEPLAGTEMVSNARFGGQPYVLVFADALCEACEGLYPHLLRASQVQGLKVLLIASGDRAAMQAKVAEHSLAFPVAFDSLLAANKPFGINAFPTAVFVDADGNIAKAASGDKGAVAVLHVAGGG